MISLILEALTIFCIQKNIASMGKFLICFIKNFFEKRKIFAEIFVGEMMIDNDKKTPFKHLK